MIFIIILLQLFALFFASLSILFALFFLLFPILRGAPFVPSRREVIEKIVSLATATSGTKVADLGAGDGRIVIALAKIGAESHGYEINPFLVWFARRNIRKAKLKNKAFIHWSSFWRHNLSSFDVVTVYGIGYIMNDLEKKLQKELKSGGKVISNTFTFPNWSPTLKDGKVYVYEKK